MTEHAEALPLEQSCIHPGLWLIEGYRVERIRISGQRVRWNVGEIGRPVANVATLAAARELIRGLR